MKSRLKWLDVILGMLFVGITGAFCWVLTVRAGVASLEVVSGVTPNTDAHTSRWWLELAVALGILSALSFISLVIVWKLRRAHADA
jgi:hypothetical protein